MQKLVLKPKGQKMFDPQEDFVEAMFEKHPEIMKSTSNDDEILYLMMGSVGRLADLFKLGDMALDEVNKQCVAIAAAAMSIALPVENETVAPEPYAEPQPEMTMQGMKQGATAKLLDFVSPPEQKKLQYKADGKRDVKFFIYKHHSYGMTKRLELWIHEHTPEWREYKSCGVDKRDRPLIGLLGENNELLAFIVSPTAQVRNGLLDFLKASYPERDGN